MHILNALSAKATRLFVAIAGITMLLSPAPSYSEPSQTPLFLQQRVQPNIMLLLDNSGSMARENILQISGEYSFFDYLDFTPFTPFIPDYIDIDGITAERLLCPGSNALMYNPSEIYTPWFGVDKDGNPYTDAEVTNARENPYLGSTGAACTAGTGVSSGLTGGSYTNTGQCDLTQDMGPDGAYYYPWEDINDNGKYDRGECEVWEDINGTGVYELFECRKYENDECQFDDEDRVFVRDMTSDEQQNFANWFSYYRSRVYVMKRALSEIISKSQERVGFAVITPNMEEDTTPSNEQFGVEIADIDTKSLPVNPAAVHNKKHLLTQLFRLRLVGYTPLRRALDNTGRYFKDGDSDAELNIGEDLFGFKLANGSPIVSANEGGECQQNFVVMLSDGEWNGPSPDNIGDADANSDNPYDGQSYADGYPDITQAEEDNYPGPTLADIAMHYYKNDLSGLPDRVPAVPIFPPGSKDDNPAQHLVTYTIAFGLSSALQKSDSTPCYPDNREQSVEAQGWPEICSDPDYTGQGSGWPDVKAGYPSTIDDMLHAAWNGRGQYLSAFRPHDLIKKLNEAISDITARTGTTPAATAVTINSTNMRAGGYIYQAEFDPEDWSGQLFAYQLTTTEINDNPVWSASQKLSEREGSRVIITFNGKKGAPFSFPDDYQDPDSSDLDSEQIEDLLTNAPHDIDTSDADEISANKAFGQALADYLRGSSEHEGNNGSYNFRPRHGKLLADIVHSAPVYVGRPNPASYPDSIEKDHSYRQWATSIATDEEDNAPYVSQRTPMIYVGTNGGGLHGFNANNGEEVFAYFPKALFSDAENAGLHWLADPGYIHRYYADQTPAIGNVFIKDAWRTVLVSGLRGGGKALFALDITDPGALADESTAATKVLWEFTHKYLGYTFGQPTLAKLNNGKWAAIFGNGYDNGPDGDGKARLFIVNLSDGKIIRIINTGVGSIENGSCSDEESKCNGLSAPAIVDLNGDGIADRAYAGDLAGNLWAFDLSSKKKSQWKKSKLFKTNDGQPITTRPAVTLHPYQRGSGTTPNTMLFFGTGQYINKTDIDNETTQSFYGIWDNGSEVTNVETNLVKQEITEHEITIDNSTYKVRTMSSNPVSYPTKRGWYVNFKTSKERTIVNPVIFGSLVIFTTIIPEQNLCGVGGGSWLMVLDSNSGGAPRFTALDINRDGLFSESDMAGDPAVNVSGLRSGDLYWQPSIIQTGSGNSGTILLPKDNESADGSKTIGQIDIQGTLHSKARSSWSHYNFQ
ncbi:MAG: hypothetical protein L3J26_00055 [Candidatus Polarisedimenticolaceae bacterium]|nr:hypothetical protein [Candidatus Polarisedimenticolaceae bacterium]